MCVIDTRTNGFINGKKSGPPNDGLPESHNPPMCGNDREFTITQLFLKLSSTNDHTVLRDLRPSFHHERRLHDRCWCCTPILDINSYDWWFSHTSLKRELDSESRTLAQKAR